MKAKAVAVVTACFFAVGASAHGDRGRSQSRSEAKTGGHGGHQTGEDVAKSDHGKKE